LIMSPATSLRKFRLSRNYEKSDRLLILRPIIGVV
jgi:hypothetical protein